MSTTIYSYVRDVSVDSADSTIPATPSILSNLTWGLFILEVVIACLALGQLVLWTTALATPDAPKLIVSACDAMFGMSMIVRRLPILFL